MIGRIVCGLLALACLGGCDRDLKAGDRRWLERQAEADPPQLWSVEAADAMSGVKPVRICTDSQMRDRFLTPPTPTVGGQPCILSQKPVQKGRQTITRCDLNGDTFMIITNVEGDPARDFTVSSSVSAVIGNGPDYDQTRHYKLISSCPDGWKLGDRTLQSGEKVSPGTRN